LIQQQKVRAEARFPLILIHTPYGLKFFDRVARTSVGRAYARFNIYLMPLITLPAIFAIAGSLAFMFANSDIRGAVREVGPLANLLIPGLNPYLPIVYGWVALVITMIVHEAGHGIVARVYNARVESTGIVLAFGIPVGAFVNIERDELAKTSLKQKSAILTAGPMNNMILAAISLLGLYLVVSTLSPLPPDPNSPQFGIGIISVTEGSPASLAGLTPDSILQYIGSEQIRSSEELRTLLTQNLGNSVQMTWTTSSGEVITRSVQLPPAPGQGGAILGVQTLALSPDPTAVLEQYKSQFVTNPFALLRPPTMMQGDGALLRIKRFRLNISDGSKYAILAVVRQF
jgi:hypothetical protein